MSREDGDRPTVRDIPDASDAVGAPVASSVPRLLNAIAVIGPTWPRKTRRSLPFETRQTRTSRSTPPVASNVPPALSEAVVAGAP